MGLTWRQEQKLPDHAAFTVQTQKEMNADG